METQTSWKLQIGAQPADGGIYFRVWAANARHVEVVLYDDEYESGMVPLEPQGEGYFASFVPHIAPDTRYKGLLASICLDDGGCVHQNGIANAVAESIIVGVKGVDVEQGEMRLAVFPDSIGQRLHAPVFDLLHRSAKLFDYPFELSGQFVDLLRREVLAGKIHVFI